MGPRPSVSFSAGTDATRRRKGDLVLAATGGNWRGAAAGKSLTHSKLPNGVTPHVKTKPQSAVPPNSYCSGAMMSAHKLHVPFVPLPAQTEIGTVPGKRSVAM